MRRGTHGWARGQTSSRRTWGNSAVVPQPQPADVAVVFVQAPSVVAAVGVVVAWDTWDTAAVACSSTDS